MSNLLRIHLRLLTNLLADVVNWNGHTEPAQVITRLSSVFSESAANKDQHREVPLRKWYAWQPVGYECLTRCLS